MQQAAANLTARQAVARRQQRLEKLGFNPAFFDRRSKVGRRRACQAELEGLCPAKAGGFN